MNSSKPKPSFLTMRAAIPLVLGVWFLSLGHAWTLALAACSLVAVTIPVVRSRDKGVAGLLPVAAAASAPEGVVWEADVLSTRGQPATFRITGVSGNTEETVGYGSEEWLASSKFWPAGMVALKDRERVLEACRSAIQEGQENLSLEYQVPNQQGQPLWIEDSVQIVRTWSGKPRKLRGRMANVTKHKLAAETLRQSQKMEEVSRLVGAAVHDFNNLLTVIGGHADLVLMSMDAKDPRRGSIEEIKKAEGRAATLARQLLAFSRRHAIKPELLDLGSLVGNLGKILRRLLPENIDLVTSAQTGSSHVFADPSQIEQVMLNLVVNARDAMPHGGRLVIEAGTCDIHDHMADGMVLPGKYSTLSVSDTGCGMDVATQKRIFEPFFTTKEPGKGTGLGLATVQEIVRERQGHIEVKSEVGKGTTFRIYLPRTELAAMVCPAATVMTSARVGSETILVVEDEENVRAVARQVLRAYGYQVLESASAEEALRLVDQHPSRIDLLLTDVVMPRMNGRDLDEALKSRLPGLKVLYMSGYNRDEMLRHAVLAQETPFIQKPFTPQALAVTVRRILDDEWQPDLAAAQAGLCLVEAPGVRPN
jgi:two-component system, cell cycle sensor histidine kinase and response regulator CckA